MRLLLFLVGVLGLCVSTGSSSTLRLGVTSVVPSRFAAAAAADSAASQALFDDAIRWSRGAQLETGGCFTRFVVAADSVHVTVLDAREAVVWRRSHATALDCGPTDGIWHTHWSPESVTAVGCDMSRAADLRLISAQAPLGVVVCGVGADSVVSYRYVAAAEVVYQAKLLAQPAFARAEANAEVARAAFSCADESAVSLRRAGIACRRARKLR